MAQFIQNQFRGGDFETTMRYSSIQPLRSSVFGLVCSADDRKYRRRVAVQKCSGPFATTSIIRHIYREIKILRHMKNENVAALVDIFISPSQDIYLVTELMEIDLQTLLKLKPIQEEFVQYFLYQIMRGIKYMHSAGVVHGDLRPSNIVVSHNCDLKIKGHGQLRVYGPWITRPVSAQHYTAPEAILERRRYDETVDIWSAGCIFAELLQGKVLFPGQNDVQQFHMITELLGKPSESVTKWITSGNVINFIQSLPNNKGLSFSDVIPGIGPSAAELLENMLVFDPRGRVTAPQALESAYLVPYHDYTDEPEAEEKVDWAFENVDLSIDAWKEKLHSEILDFHKKEALREAIERWLHDNGTGPSVISHQQGATD